MKNKKIGRLMIEESKYTDLFFKLNFLDNLKNRNIGKKKIKDLEENVLNLNSFYQNDFFSGSTFIFEFRKFFSKTMEHILGPHIQHNTRVFYLFLQKTITGNSFRVNRFFFDYLFPGYTRKILIFDFLKIYNSYDFLFGSKSRFSGILPFVISFIKENNRKKCITLILNQVFFKYIDSKNIESYFSFKLKPFITNCSFSFMEFFGIKLLFFYRSIIEHLTFKLRSATMKKGFRLLFYNDFSRFKESFYKCYEFSNCLHILQSIESSSVNCQILRKQTLIVYKWREGFNENFHPLLITLLKKNKSYFFF